MDLADVVTEVELQRIERVLDAVKARALVAIRALKRECVRLEAEQHLVDEQLAEAQRRLRER